MFGDSDVGVPGSLEAAWCSWWTSCQRTQKGVWDAAESATSQYRWSHWFHVERNSGNCGAQLYSGEYAGCYSEGHREEVFFRRDLSWSHPSAHECCELPALKTGCPSWYQGSECDHFPWSDGLALAWLQHRKVFKRWRSIHHDRHNGICITRSSWWTLAIREARCVVHRFVPPFDDHG